MTTIAQASAAVRARLEANFTAATLHWQNEDNILPDTPEAFVFVEPVIVEGHEFIAFGGGQGGNLQLTEGRFEAQVMVPLGTGVASGLAWAEEIATVFRSQTFSDVSCWAAQAYPGSGRTEDGSYAHVATVIVDLHFYMTG